MYLNVKIKTANLSVSECLKITKSLIIAKSVEKKKKEVKTNIWIN